MESGDFEVETRPPSGNRLSGQGIRPGRGGTSPKEVLMRNFAVKHFLERVNPVASHPKPDPRIRGHREWEEWDGWIAVGGMSKRQNSVSNFLQCDSPNGLEEIHRTYWLRKVSVHTGGDTKLLISLHRMRRESDDREVSAG